MNESGILFPKERIFFAKLVLNDRLIRCRLIEVTWISANYGPTRISFYQTRFYRLGCILASKA